MSLDTANLNLIYDRTESDETASAAIRKSYQTLGNWSGLTDAERAQLERGALTYNTLNRVESAVKLLAAALTSAGYPVKVTPVLKGNSRVPVGYTEVEWIQSSGTQYIDTGASFSNGVRAETKFNLASITSSSKKTPIFGAHNASEPYGRDYLSVDSSKNFEVGGGSGCRFFKNYAVTANTDYEVIMSNIPMHAELTVNGETVDSTGGTTYATPFTDLPLYLFRVNITNGSWFENASMMKLYYLKMYDDADTLVRNFVPCKNPSGIVGLYDLVGGQFYGNSGTGAFTAGAEIGKIEDREWQEGDVLYRPQWTTYLGNVQRLRDAYYTLAETGELPAPGDKLKYTGANNIEKVLADIDLLVDCMKSSYRRCGTFRAGNNAAHLPLKGRI